MTYLTLSIAGSCVLLLVLHTLRFWPFLADDALISLRYAMRLLDGHGLTWTDGPRVEGYSNLAWILMSAALGGMGIDLIVATRVLGCAASSTTIVMVVWTFMRGGGPGAALGALAAGLFIVASAPMAVWTIGGLETPLVAACLATAWALLWPDGDGEIHPRRLLAASIPLGVLVWTRPDGPLFTAMAAAWLLFLNGKPSRSSLVAAARVATIPFVMFMAQMAFRMHYYGELIPNTARVKISPSDRHFEQGIEYLRSFLVSAAPFAIISIHFCVLAIIGRPQWARDSRRRVLLVAVPALAWAWYVCWIGGDVFPAFRHGVPLIVAMAFMAGEGVRALCAFAEGRAWGRTPLIASAICIIAALQVAAGWRHEENRRPLTEHWEWDGQVVGTMLKRGFAGKAPLLAVDAAGTTPYFSEFPCVDMLGLNDHYLARNKPKHFGKKRIGHELGDGKYVLSRKPDLVAFGYDWRYEAYEHGAMEMQESTEFLEHYRWCTFLGEEPYSYKFGLWIREDSPKVGIKRTNGEITIPGYFLTGDEAMPARLDESGRFYINVEPGSVPSIANLTITEGTWTVTTVPAEASAELVVTLRRMGDMNDLGPVDDMSFVIPPGGAVVSMKLESKSPVAIEKVVLTRTPDMDAGRV